MADASVTRYALSLGSRDDTTGWRDKSYSTSIIDAVIRPRGQSIFQLGVGGMAKYEDTGFTPDVVHEGDLWEDANSTYYEVKTAEEEWWLDQFSHYVCNLTKLKDYPEADVELPTATEEDARYRNRVWVNAHVSLATDWASMYAFPDYPLHLEFTGDDAEDVLYCINHPQTTPLLTYNHYTYGFYEQVPITIAVLQQYSQDDTQKLLWAAEDALRIACRSHPLGSVRTLNVIRDRTMRMGSATVVMRECIINYKRSSEYTTTYPRLTWGESGNPDGTYYFPNCTRIRYPNGVPDVKLLPPGRVGNVHQIVGDTSLVVELTCDLDVDNTTYTWERPQTSTPKTDNMEWQVLLEIKHNAGIVAGDEPYQTLYLDWGYFNVRLVSFDVNDYGDGRTLTALFEEYCATDQSGSSVTTRYHIT